MRFFFRTAITRSIFFSTLSMADDGEGISAKTWARVLGPINKAGFMNGAADGQSAVFQSSFDMGYEQGMSFGIEMGIREAMLRYRASSEGDRSSEPILSDQRRINCQICINSTTAQEDIVNLYNYQREKNYEHLEKIRKTEIDRIVQ